ncbi:HAMP domain-containing protein [Leptolyngbya sp. PCC 6406]|uniref:HAMP domain-containing protein n=1 Tax=Leptolyngbya sp. PCC 6406 TaxID=1173264 RepID=UPI0002ACAB2E|nr:methyl-accepting chemotaxis protein [Leptolyngbya sp. PCC 6406]
MVKHLSTRFSTKMKEGKRLFKSPLSLRIVLGIFVSLVVIEGIVLVPSVQRRKQEILSQIEEVSFGKINWILMTYPTASGPELLAQLEQLQREPMMQIILGGAVYEANGRVVGTFGEVPALPPEEARQGNQRYLETDQGSRYDVAWLASQSDGGDEYVLLLRHDADGTRMALVFYILRITGIVLLISAFITLVMMVLLSRQLITPVLILRRDLILAGDALAKLTEGIATDQPAPPFQSDQFQRRDELGEVIAAFQQMYQQICQAIRDRKQAEAELRHSNEQMQKYLQQVDRVTDAATAVDEGTFIPESLDEVAARSDELGKLAQMFQMMASHVKQREARLQQQLADLTIEIDQAKRLKQVAQITKSDYFQEVQKELQTYQADQFWGEL